MGEAHTGDGAERRCSKGHRMYLWDPTLVYPDRTDDTDIRWKCPACGEERSVRSDFEFLLKSLPRSRAHRWNGPLPDVGEVADDPGYFG